VIAFKAALHYASYTDFLASPLITILPVVIDMPLPFSENMQVLVNIKLLSTLLLNLEFFNPGEERMKSSMSLSEILMMVASYRQQDNNNKWE
jgi:hypothetical protein